MQDLEFTKDTVYLITIASYGVHIQGIFGKIKSTTNKI